ncbi:hypothetical protein O0555_11910 [Brevibacillus laterosporus]|nr:hypothetical protein [Brevibacillus laterosporus]MBG9797115.1 hypothetical protein [Brevibacillus laterosporus]MCR8938055.1 hypothetical protein [Brevibacillus laterosporus]MCZ0840695.1 hypothetical protein [Brevibacillus laterosporus]MCZ0847492.1 hypothetical protein [Brevibacillus laterosporus]MED1909221.1 hypothetical protein [Brevibacillus laterosporus]
MLFLKEYSFRGSHAEKVNKLTSQFDESASSKFFNRNIDVYILAPLIGFLYGRKAALDKSGSETTKIFPEQLIKEQTILKYNYQLIMLLDKKNEGSFDERLNKAFRNYGNESEQTLSDEQSYEHYVLGGVDVLYEKLIEGATTSEDYIAKLYDFMEEFNDRYNETGLDEKILDLCALARS